MITLICFGKLKDSNLSNLAEEYKKRLTKFPFLKLEIKEYKDDSKKGVEEKVKTLPKDAILLDEHGTTYKTEEFLKLLKPTISENTDVTLVIGGPDGFSDELKQQYRRISLSPMTFTHEMARVLLLEQLYRAATIHAGIPYHKQ